MLSFTVDSWTYWENNVYSRSTCSPFLELLRINYNIWTEKKTSSEDAQHIESLNVYRSMTTEQTSADEDRVEWSKAPQVSKSTLRSDFFSRSKTVKLNTTNKLIYWVSLHHSSSVAFLRCFVLWPCWCLVIDFNQDLFSSYRSYKMYGQARCRG